MVQLSHLYMTTGKTIALTRWTFVGKVMSLLFNMLSRFVTAFLSRIKYLLISWQQSPSTVLFSQSLQFLNRVRLCDPMNCSTSGFPVHHQLSELAQTHVYQVGDAIQPSHPLSSSSPPALKLSKHQGLFKWVNSLHQVAKVLEFQLQHRSFQWIFRNYFL